MNKKLSIIIPIYRINREANFFYFEKLIISIVDNIVNDVNQYEIIIVNDSPEEDCEILILKIIDKYSLSDITKYFSNERNIGQANSRNRGANFANGEFLHFIDQDDFIDNSFYSNLISKSTDVGIANIKIFNETDSKNLYRIFALFLLSWANNIKSLRLFLLGNIANSPGQYIIKKKTFEQVGGFPSLINKGCDDYGFLFLLTLQDNIRVKFHPKCFFNYRFHTNQAFRSLNMHQSLLEFFDKVRERKLPTWHSIVIFLRTDNLTKVFVKYFWGLFMYKRVKLNNSKY